MGLNESSYDPRSYFNVNILSKENIFLQIHRYDYVKFFYVSKLINKIFFVKCYIVFLHACRISTLYFAQLSVRQKKYKFPTIIATGFSSSVVFLGTFHIPKCFVFCTLIFLYLLTIYSVTFRISRSKQSTCGFDALIGVE